MTDGDQAFELSAAQRACFRRAGPIDVVRVRVEAGPAPTSGSLAHDLGELAGHLEILRTRFERTHGVALPLQVVGAEPVVGRSADGASAGGVVLGSDDAVVGARVADGHLELWASETLADAESLLHLAALLGGSAELEAEPLQYADFAGWEAEQVAERSPEQRVAAAFWATAAEGSDAGSASAPDATAAVQTAPVSAPTDDRAGWLLAWVAALQRNAVLEQGACVVGTRIPGRPGDELAAAIGPFAREVPLPVGAVLDADVARARAELAVGLADAERFAVFAPDDVHSTVRFRWLPAGSQVADPASLPEGVRAQLTVIEGGPATVSVRTGVVPVARLAAHLGTLVDALAAGPGGPVGSLPMLTADEVRELATTGTAQPVAVAAGPLLAAFDRAAAAHPERIAVRDAHGELSYDAVAARVDAVAAGLQSRGLSSGAVAVLVDRSTDTVVALLAAMRCGVPFVPMRADLPAARRRALLESAQAGVVLGAGAGAATGDDDGVPRFSVAELASSAGSPSPATAGDVLYLLATSGSTGTPKLVEVTNANASAYTAAVTERLGLAEGCTLGVATSLSTDLAYTMLFPAWLLAGTVVLLDDEVVTDAAALDRVLAEAAVDAVKLTPSLLRAVLAGEGARLRVPLLVLGGEALTYADVARARAAGAVRVVNHYGPTETTVGVTTHELDAGADGEHTGVVPIGRPLPGTRVAVLDAARQLVPAGVLGELAIAGPGVSNGYRNDAGQTSAAFVPAWDGAGVMYLTGDRAGWDATGRLVFHGRGDGQVKIRGYRVELGEIEQALRALPGVIDAAVLVDPDDPEADRLVAYVASGTRTPDELRSALVDVLPPYMVPAAVAVVPVLPRMPNGKLDRSALPTPSAAGAAAVTPPDTETERALLALWQEVLAVGAIGVEDDFFYLGGHSLVATRIIARARSSFGVDLPLHVIFSSPTVRTMAAEIDERRGAAAATPDDDMDSLLASLENMSEAEAQALLDAELGKPLRPE